MDQQTIDALIIGFSSLVFSYGILIAYFIYEDWGNKPETIKFLTDEEKEEIEKEKFRKKLEKAKEMYLAKTFIK